MSDIFEWDFETESLTGDFSTGGSTGLQDINSGDHLNVYSTLLVFSSFCFSLFFGDIISKL